MRGLETDHVMSGPMRGKKNEWGGDNTQTDITDPVRRAKSVKNLHCLTRNIFHCKVVPTFWGSAKAMKKKMSSFGLPTTLSFYILQ